MASVKQFTKRTANAPARARDYFRAGEERAYSLGNRGPLRFADDGTLHPEVLASYWEHGFYVLEGVLGDEELGDLHSELAGLLDRAPVAPDAELDRHGERAFGDAFTTPVFSFGKPCPTPTAARMQTMAATLRRCPSQSRPKTHRHTPSFSSTASCR